MDEGLIRYVAKAIKDAAEFPIGLGGPFGIIYRTSSGNAQCEMLDGDWEMIARQAIDAVNSYKHPSDELRGIANYSPPQIYSSPTHGNIPKPPPADVKGKGFWGDITCYGPPTQNPEKSEFVMEDHFARMKPESYEKLKDIFNDTTEKIKKLDIQT